MKLSTFSFLLSSAVTAAALTGCATRSNFDIADDDGSGALSYAEVERALLTGIFDKGDPNGDGKISWEEVKAVAPSYPRSRFDERDADGDGAVSPAELDAYAESHDSFAALIKSMDSNGDGEIDRAEAEAFNARLMAAPGDSTLEKLYYLNSSLSGK